MASGVAVVKQTVAGTKGPRLLSKSRYVAGLQCEKRLYLECYRRDLMATVGAAQQAIFDQGHEVGVLATQRYPGGVLIEADHLHHDEAMAATQAAMANPKVPAIFEAAFLHDGVRIRADILVREKGGAWSLEEVKSSTGVKEVHQGDLAVQIYVLRGCGLRLKHAGILHLNKDYVRKTKKLDLDELFELTDLLDGVAGGLEDVKATVRRLHKVLALAKPPTVEPGAHCSSPYECPFMGECIPPPGPYSLSRIPQSGKLVAKLGKRVVDDVRKLPASVSLSATQARAVECLCKDTDYVGPELGKSLAAVTYPLHFLDFETVNPGVPRYVKTGVYQQLPFQWSDHVLHADGRLAHREFLHGEDVDPRVAFADSLVEALGDEGTICVYSPFEATQVRALAAALPKHRKPLTQLLGRLWDILPVLRAHYYHPAFNGSFSIKSVLPALVPHMTYDGLLVGEGGEASAAYLETIGEGCPKPRRSELRKALLTYCKQDTLAMVEVRRVLLERAQRVAKAGKRA